MDDKQENLRQAIAELLIRIDDFQTLHRVWLILARKDAEKKWN